MNNNLNNKRPPNHRPTVNPQRQQRPNTDAQRRRPVNSGANSGVHNRPSNPKAIPPYSNHSGQRPVNPVQNRRPPENAYRHSGYYRPKKRTINDYLTLCLILLSVLLLTLIVVFAIVKSGPSDKNKGNEKESSATTDPVGNETDTKGNESQNLDLPVWNKIPDNQKAFLSVSNGRTSKINGDSLYSKNAILVDLKTMTSFAEYRPDEKIFPASMTKVMTMIVAAENISDMSKTFVLTKDIVIPLEKQGATMAYFDLGQPIKLYEYFYGCCLPSGADATAALAISVAGSEEEFVKLMNKKASDMGLKNTHFTNCSGLHDENHYSSVRDIASIMAYAMENPFLRQVLSTKAYKAQAKVKNLDNTFYCSWSGKYNKYPFKNAVMFGAKSGFTDHARQCLVSVSKDSKGNEYVLVTAGGTALAGSSVDKRLTPYIDAKYIFDTFVK